jgi:GH25 family lysozyme M1 (1,4-beta-N-acetylmuramidase)
MNLFQGIIDIYDGNDRIDLDDAWNRGVRAILHQTSRGTYRTDALYAERKKRALDMNFLWAGYHLLSAEDVGDQLNYFLAIEDGSDPRVGLAIDWEKSRKGTATGDQVRDFVGRFNKAMKPRYPDRYPILYGGNLVREDAGIQAGDTLLAKCPLWYVRYNAAGPIEIPAKTWPTYTLWQFDNEKRKYGGPPSEVLPGADFNRFQGTDAELRSAWPFGGAAGGGALPVDPQTGKVIKPAQAPVAGFAGRAISLAIQEWNFFGDQTYDINGHATHVGHKEGEPGWYQRVGTYWKEGVHINGIDGRDDVPWSAAFISWLMRTAGAGVQFNYSEGHSHYIHPAIIAKRNGDTSAGYWCSRLNEAKPVPGDLLCYARQPGIDYDHQDGGDYKAHTDLVVKVGAGQVEVIGGNVGNSVTRRPIPLDEQGHLVQHVVSGELLFGLMQNRIA